MDWNTSITHPQYGFGYGWGIGEFSGVLDNGHDIYTGRDRSSAQLLSRSLPELHEGIQDLPVKDGFEGIACDIAAGEALIGAQQANLVHEVELQACSMCPKNFIIFDQTHCKSRMMFHPALSDRIANLGFHNISCFHENHGESKESSFKEDTRDIDALLSSDEYGDEEEEISTGRSPWDHGSSTSPDTLSTATSRGMANAEACEPYEQNREGATVDVDCAQPRVQKLIEALREIVPGGERMDTADVLDEALRYLKLLKMEVRELGLV